MKKPTRDGLESHHMPAASIIIPPLANKKDGPAIQMDPDDHKDTASHSRSPMYDARLQNQQSDVRNGRFGRAQELDIIDVRTKFGTKYDDAIAQMEAYTECLEQQGRI